MSADHPTDETTQDWVERAQRLRELTNWTPNPSLPAGAEGPPCIWCNAPTRRTGSCFTCIACGASTSC